MNNYTIETIAVIHNDYKEKFGIPRQSCLLDSNISIIEFNDKYSDANALRGIEGYSHLWLLWIFDKNNSDKSWSPTVRPPRLGGNTRTGVFSTRSPYHPNRIGLSCVRFIALEKVNGKTILKVAGADLLDGTPIIDIKPYLKSSDSHPDAICGFADDVSDYKLDVKLNNSVKSDLSETVINEIIKILEQDPRPSYQNDPDRIYAMKYADYDIKFKVMDNQLTVTSIQTIPNGSEK